MSLHPSLKIDSAGVQQRSVLTRIERIKDLMKKDLWKEDQNVTGLPKTKILKIKTAKKEKKEAAPAEGGAVTAAPEAKGEAKAEPKKTEAKKKA